ncbi:MAG: hypothetical protein K6A63_08450 [Acholeplasmatales bacterium]|nr:hypothetical protein [Acholeplasmatales bacterium]
MKIYLVEYINSDVYKLLKEKYEFTDKIEECDIVISRNLIIDKTFIDKAKNLKCAAMYGTGVDGIDLDYAKSKGITVFNAPKFNSLSVAELNVSLMLAISRKLEKGIHDTKVESVIDYSGMLGNEITGKTVGFVGLGKISMLTAKMLKFGFECNIKGWSRTKKNIDYINETTLDDVLDSDYVILGLALNDETRHFINLEKLTKMKKTTYLINACRGGLVAHDDLVYALKNNIIRGYATDVFEHEPVDINDELLKLNVLSLPHVGGNTEESLYRVGIKIKEQIDDFLAGKEPEFKIV